MRHVTLQSARLILKRRYTIFNYFCYHNNLILIVLYIKVYSIAHRAGTKVFSFYAFSRKHECLHFCQQNSGKNAKTTFAFSYEKLL
jgi:hypothetical protein